MKHRAPVLNAAILVVAFAVALAAQSRQDRIEELRSAAEQGHVLAQYALGMAYYTYVGEGVTDADAEAARWFRRAAEQGHADAQNLLGYIYRTGQGVPHSDAEAVRWYRLAAEQGYARAQFNLGNMYVDGRGVLQDYVQAHKWLNLAASQENPGVGNVVEHRSARDAVAGQMTASQVAEAQRLAREWQPKTWEQLNDE